MTDDLLHDLGKELPFDRPDEARRDAVRASLLAAAARREETPPQRMRVVVAFGAGALAAAAIAMLVIGRRAPVAAPAVENARIESSSAAQLEHTVATTATGTEEIVRVHGGVVRLALAPVKAGDRVAIVTADAEVAGAGAYEVAVRDDKLASVTVTAGTAKIAVTGQKAVFLAAGETWHSEIWTAELTPAAPAPAIAPAPVVAAPPAVVTPPPVVVTPPSVVVAPPVAVAIQHVATAPVALEPDRARGRARARDTSTTAALTPPTAAPPTAVTPQPAVATSVAPPVEAHPAVTAPAPVAPSQTEQHFERGWKLLKDGKAIEAANELGVAAEGDGPLAVDARYFQAEALVKAGRKTEAEKALVGFLDHAPQSLRRGRAAVMLARLIAERGDKAAARNWFQSAVSDADPAVAAAARAGLAAL